VAEQTIQLEISGTVPTATTRTNVGPPARRSVVERFELDGKPHPFTPLDRVGSGPASGTRTAAWSEDRNGRDVSETVTREFNGRSATAAKTHRWRLSEYQAEDPRPFSRCTNAAK